MPTSAAGSNAGDPASGRADAGFTLVELMVTIVVIALASAAAVMAIPDRRGRVLDEATRFAGRVRAAHDMAVIDSRSVSLWVTAGGYGFDERVAGRWMPVADQPLRVAQWEEGTRVVLPDAGGRVRLVFDPTGLADRPLDVPLARSRGKTIVRIGADGSVDVAR